MTLPSASNAISMSDIRTEFGVSGELSLGDLYQASGTGATNLIVKNVDSNDAIPESGAISFGDFHGITGNSVTAHEVATLLTSSDNINYCVSKASFASGMRTDTTAGTSTFDQVNSHDYRTSTSVSGSNTFSSFPNGIWGTASGSTHIAMNYNHGNTDAAVGWPAITIGGSGVSETNASNCNLIFNYYSNNKVNTIVRWGYFKSDSNLNGLTVGATYSKTNTNFENRQMFFALPGKWSDVLHNNTTSNSFDIDADTALTGTTSFTAQKGDIVFTISSQWYDGYVSHGTTVSNSTSVLYHRSRWYHNTNVRMFVIDTAGSCTINANSYATSYIVFRLD